MAQGSEETRMMGLPEGQKSFKIGLAVLFCFSKKFNVTNIHPLSINGNNINRVTTFKLLGVFSQFRLIMGILRYVPTKKSSQANVLY